MAITVRQDANLYTKPPKTAIPGARMEYRNHVCLATELVAGTSAVIHAIGVLPAGHRATYLRVETEALDANVANKALTFSVGLLNSYYGDPIAGNYCSRLDANGAAMGNNGWDAGASPVLASGYIVITNSTVGQNGGVALTDTDANGFVARKWGVDAKNDRIIAMQVTTNAAGGNANNGANFAIVLGMDID